MRKGIQLSISLGLTVLIGYLIYRGVPDWGQAWDVMLNARARYLILAFAFVMLHMVFRSLRWGVLLSPVKRKISLRNLFSLTLVKYTINVIPPRAGEVVASVVLAKKEKISSASVIAASLLERILDIMTVMVIFGFYISFLAHRYPPDSERGKDILLAIQAYSTKGFVVLCLGFLFLGLVLKNSHWLEILPAKLRSILLPFLEGFRALQQGGALLWTVAFSLAIWTAITLQLWCLMNAYLQGFPFVGAVFLMAVTVVGVAIPTPGGVGGFQFFMDLTLVNFFSAFLSSQDPHSQAAGISNGSYLVSMVPVILIGLYFLNREGLSLSRISEFAHQAEMPVRKPEESAVR
ncbi:MAG: lysylphosphatidylglycerol synthase transmembrane domain-containing protein [Acidobacteriota bacterium]